MNWSNVLTVICATIVVGTECVAAGYAAAWAIASLLGLVGTAAYVVQGAGIVLALLGALAFAKQAMRVEPFKSTAS
jgi:hypothetical protein